MSCENPLRIPNPRYAKFQDKVYWLEYYRDNFNVGLPDEYIDVPCGKCYSCRKSRANGWRLRLNAEFEKYPNSIFITLTFDEKNLRRFRYKPNRSISLFLDRVRKYLGKQIRHFITGEYGETTIRFHYHGILFDVPDGFDADTLAKLWKYGFCYVGWCSKATITYILKYITKVDDKGNSLPLPRLVVSKGIGEHFVEQYKNEPLKRDMMTYLVGKNGAKITLPRYIKNKMYDEDDLCAIRVSNFLKPFRRYVNGVCYTDPLSYKVALNEFFNSQISLGLSPAPIKKQRKSFIQPIIERRYIEPYSLTDFYSPNECRFNESNFAIENVPF